MNNCRTLVFMLIVLEFALVSVEAQETQWNDLLMFDHNNRSVTVLINTTSMRKTRIRKSDMQEIIDAKPETLNFSNVVFDNEVIERFKELNSLRFIRIGNGNINDRDLQSLLSAGPIRELHLPNSDLTDDSVATFLKCKSLVSISVGSTAISIDGIKRLRASGLRVDVTP